MQNYEKSWKMTETMAYGYSSESTQQELSNEYQHNKGLNGFQNFLLFSPMDESSLSMERVKDITPPAIGKFKCH